MKRQHFSRFDGNCLPSSHLYFKLQLCSWVRPVAPATTSVISAGASFVGRIAILRNPRTASAACFLPQGRNAALNTIRHSSEAVQGTPVGLVRGYRTASQLVKSGQTFGMQVHLPVIDTGKASEGGVSIPCYLHSLPCCQQ